MRTRRRFSWTVGQMLLAVTLIGLALGWARSPRYVWERFVERLAAGDVTRAAALIRGEEWTVTYRRPDPISGDGRHCIVLTRGGDKRFIFWKPTAEDVLANASVEEGGAVWMYEIPPGWTELMAQPRTWRQVLTGRLVIRGAKDSASSGRTQSHGFLVDRTGITPLEAN